MPKTLINHQTTPQVKVFAGDPLLSISEMFTQTLQGEGFYIGTPATFLRVSGCHINCKFCDSALIWRKSHAFNLNEVLDILESSGTVERFRQGEHFIITGGAPLLQEDEVLLLLQMFEKRFEFVPFIQVENECTIEPSKELLEYVSCWNNSPKLKNSQVEQFKRYKPRVIKKMSSLDNSWFKFVVGEKSDWEEIDLYYLQPKLIKREQIILMPKGWGREELEENRVMVAELAMEKGVRFSDRLQITLYDMRVSV